MQTKNEEEELVRSICEAIGYGRTMQLASQLWAKKDRFGELGAFVVGPCRSLVVDCPHPKEAEDANGHCDLCCGSGHVTKLALKSFQLSFHS